MNSDIKNIIWLLAFVACIGFISTQSLLEHKTIDEPIVKSWYFPFRATTTPTKYQIRQMTANKIRFIARERNFKWVDYAVNIACEESLLGTDMVNDKGNTPSYSVDRGYYMFNDYWHKEVSEECANDIYCSTNRFMDLVEQGRQTEWVADRKVKGIKNYAQIKCEIS